MHVLFPSSRFPSGGLPLHNKSQRSTISLESLRSLERSSGRFIVIRRLCYYRYLSLSSPVLLFFFFYQTSFLLPLNRRCNSHGNEILHAKILSRRVDFTIVIFTSSRVQMNYARSNEFHGRNNKLKRSTAKRGLDEKKGLEREKKKMETRIWTLRVDKRLIF